MANIAFRQTALLLPAGVAIGVVVALATAQGGASLLFGLRANDPSTFLGASALLTLVALWACYLPAHKAMRVDPMVAVRFESCQSLNGISTSAVDAEKPFFSDLGCRPKGD